MAAVIEEDGRFLVTLRHGRQHLSGLWEFPGGKIEPGESPEACLRREILEELNVDSTIGAEVLTTTHEYPDRTVRLHFHRCRIHGAPRPLAGQKMRWVTRDELAALDFPAADRELVERLRSELPA
jgi:mutator protein MutT